VRIEIDLDEAAPPGGRVRADGGPPVAFSGWLGLLRILERLTVSAELAPERLGDELDA
jgi:hypothetical protein